MNTPFDLSRYPENIQNLCKWSEETKYSPLESLDDETDFRSLYYLTEADIPNLVEIAARARDAEIDFPDELMQAPTNAWKALAQFATPALLPTLLDVINHIHWEYADYCYTCIRRPFVRAGVDDIFPLLEALRDGQRHEETHYVIIEALSAICKLKPEQRDLVVQALVGELSKMEIGRRKFYGHIVFALLKLEAKEALPLIETAYKRGLVEPDYCDYLENIQKTLGGEVVSDPEMDRFEGEMEEVAGIFYDFKYCDTTFPRDAVLRARQLRDVIIPSLIEEVRLSTAYARYDVPIMDSVNLFAVHLLAEFQAREALPYLLESLSITSDQAWELYSDCLYESVPAIMYRIIGNDVSFYTNYLHKRETPPILRDILAVALPFLVKSGALDRGSYLILLRKLFRLAIDESNDDFAKTVLDLLLECGDKNDVPLVREAHEKGVWDEEFIDLEGAIGELNKEGEQFEEAIIRRTRRKVDDTIEAMSEWASFQPETKNDSPYVPPPLSPTSKPLSPSFRGGSLLERVHEVGRNDPCPCNSGKKYKKCCGK